MIGGEDSDDDIYSGGEDIRPIISNPILSNGGNNTDKIKINNTENNNQHINEQNNQQLKINSLSSVNTNKGGDAKNIKVININDAHMRYVSDSKSNQNNEDDDFEGGDNDIYDE